MNEKICFVVIGYGIKTDYPTGRKLDLDKTFENLIKPVFDELKITCIRASDIPHFGVIDVPMYENILKADIVVADISTLNPNAIYELGVRHALKPYTTIIIAEDKITAYPFDLARNLITSYEHLGTDIGVTEARRFHKALKEKVENILNAKEPQIDSPVYTYLTELKPPEFTKKEIAQLKKAAHDAQSISALLKEADELKNQNQFEKGLEKMEMAKEQSPDNPTILQKIALLTYKSKKPDPLTALKKAELILQALNPETTNDVETLGLLGAINKRLYEQTDIVAYLQKSLGYYERGFVVAGDYYNGINLAFLYLLSATRQTDPNEKNTDICFAKRIRAKVRTICEELMRSISFIESPDKVWVLLTKAELAFTEGNIHEEQKYIATAKLEGAADFAIRSYEEQRERIERLLQQLNMRT